MRCLALSALLERDAEDRFSTDKQLPFSPKSTRAQKCAYLAGVIRTDGSLGRKGGHDMGSFDMQSKRIRIYQSNQDFLHKLNTKTLPAILPAYDPDTADLRPIDKHSGPAETCGQYKEGSPLWTLTLATAASQQLVPLLCPFMLIKLEGLYGIMGADCYTKPLALRTAEAKKHWEWLEAYPNLLKALRGGLFDGDGGVAFNHNRVGQPTTYLRLQISSQATPVLAELFAKNLPGWRFHAKGGKAQCDTSDGVAAFITDYCCKGFTPHHGFKPWAIAACWMQLNRGSAPPSMASIRAWPSCDVTPSEDDYSNGGGPSEDDYEAWDAEEEEEEGGDGTIYHGSKFPASSTGSGSNAGKDSCAVLASRYTRYLEHGLVLCCYSRPRDSPPVELPLSGPSPIQAFPHIAALKPAWAQ